MAANATSATDPNDRLAALALAETYNRIRGEARRLNERAGWSVEDFERELPVIQIPPELQGHISMDTMKQLAKLGAQARLGLSQLSGWAEGNVEAFKIEEAYRAEKIKPKKTGFS